jgi:phage portal protein BeeE
MGIFENLQRLGWTAAQLAVDGFQKAATVLAPVPLDDGADTMPGNLNADTAISNPVPTEKADQDPKALFFDPFSIIEQLGFKDRPSQVTYGTLKAITWRVPIIQAIVQTRIQQIAAFCRPQHDRYQLGYRLKLREQEKEPSPAERQWMTQMENVLTRTGITDNPRGRDSFEKFLRKLAWDSLIYDQMCFEVVPNRRGQPAEWYAVDAATIRLADSASTYMNEDLDTAIRYVQIYDGMIIAEYTCDELCFMTRNPRTDIRLHGYGVSELEMLIPTVTSILYAMEYNQKFFSQGSAAKGIINFKGTVPEKQLQAFRRHWYQMLSGVENAWRTPITNSDELQYINLQQSSRDMEFNSYMDFLIKIACAMYTIDPAEINFKYGNVGQKGGLQESSNKEKVVESKERGLRPLLRHIAQAINQYIIWPINEEFEFDFVGLDAKTKDEIADLNMKRVKSFCTVDELRAEDDLSPLPNGQGEVILDPTWLQFNAQKQAAAMGGMPGAGSQMGNPPQPDGTVPGGGNPIDFESLLRQYDGEDETGGDINASMTKSARKKWIVNL